MTRKQMLTTGAIAGGGLVLALLIVLAPPPSAPADEHGHGDEHAEGETFERGPHDGRLLEIDSFPPEAEGERALEVTIYETGVAPELRLYPYEGDEPADPRALDLTVELHRLGGIVDTLRFRPTGPFLRGDRVVYEPHSFDVVVRGTWGGAPVRWEYASYEGRVEMAAAIAEANGIEVEEAGPQPLQTLLELPGEVQLNADRVARVAPRLSGTVVSVPAGLGQRVGAGAVLAVIESRELGQAQRDYVETLHRLELAQAAYERERRLHERRISATREYEQARHELEEAELEKQAAEAALRALGVPPAQLTALGVEPEGPVPGERELRRPIPTSLTRYAVRAPTGGQVVERNLAVGQHVSGMEEAFVVADLSTVWVEATVYASDLDGVRAGQAAVVRAEGDTLGATVGRGTVRYVGPIVGEATRTARALVVLPNDGRWRPGQFVTVALVQDEETVPVAVRAEAVQTWREMDVVFARFGNVFEVRPVTLGRRDGAWVEVTEGLAPGQAYAAAGAYVLKADLEKAGASHDH
jgi:cobalt-zinc-cadmium efflux system membrane fusion protein